MPLLSGKSNDIIAENVRTLKNEGKSAAQASAIAYSKAGRTKKKSISILKKVTKRNKTNRIPIRRM